ncbi:bromodomain-containing protein DDB_G0270170 [Ochlerotatus camptorhynchus]|uniref:bromodomain-containing protein DDB_G0270170 n=1 Tax=Ochlerotatus camptorhynchus TaxID=644619 RepID=UPI0031D39557
MIRDPGAGPHESPEPQPTIKYERIVYDMHRPPVPVAVPPVTPMDLDLETPLDMTVRRKDSSDRQSEANAPATVADHQPNSNSGGGNDAPINLNTRPSVITKAPPPPIKKRISSMHSNGEIVIKSAVGDNLSPVNCDVFIEEHFRRSLGNTYASIYGNNNNNNQQKSSGSDTRNSSTSSSSSISSSSSNSSNNSTALSTSSSSSGISSVASVVGGGTSNNASSLIGNSVNFSASSQLGSVSPIVRHNHVIPSTVEISPMLNVKVEPGLAQSHVRPELTIKTEPGTVQHVRPDSEEEVDDHFAKALGNDTWKMIQEKKMNL